MDGAEKSEFEKALEKWGVSTFEGSGNSFADTAEFMVRFDYMYWYDYRVDKIYRKLVNGKFFKQ